MDVRTKRVYEQPAPEDGYRVLVDRLWPRGRSKEAARLDEWLKEIAPSDQLRKWYGHEPGKWPEFKQRYFAELEDKQDLVGELLERAEEGTVTLLFAAKDEAHNNAVALKHYLLESAGQ